MLADKPDAVAPLPKPAGLRAADAHRMFLNPDEFAEVFDGLDCTAVAQLVEQLTAHLSTATHVDGVAVIDELAFVCADDRPGGSARRSLSDAVAEFGANCMRFVDEDDAEIIIEFALSAPLIYGFDLLCKVGLAHGLVRGSNADKLGRTKRQVTDDKAIEHAIEVWRQRVTRVIESGYVMEEGDLFVFLDGLARLGVGATDADAFAALSEFCTRAPAGFAYFLQQARMLPVDGMHGQQTECILTNFDNSRRLAAFVATFRVKLADFESAPCRLLKTSAGLARASN